MGLFFLKADALDENKLYFYLILKQEQGWFDKNNAFQFATKVQAQLEQIEMGVGDRFGQVILMSSELISGLVVGFISSWKLTLMLLCLSPFYCRKFYHYDDLYGRCNGFIEKDL